MARGYGNFAYVADTSFNPFQSMQEMLVPFSAYKDAYERTEAAYDELTSQSDKFKYLSETLPEDSRARQIYEEYAADLNKQANDLASHGLNINNRRALTQLKRRYQGEIGRLDEASKAYQEEMALRRQMDSKDASMLYASDNLSIDDFLDNNKPNLYNISGTELYSRGAAAGKAASSRIYNAGDGGSTLGGYYRKWVEMNGYSPESIAAFREGVADIPELTKAADDILSERGVYENFKDNPINLARARQSVINGIIDGAVYNEKVNVQRDLGQLTESERISNQRAIDQFEYNMALNGIVKDKNGEFKFDPDKSLEVQKTRALQEEKNKSKTGTGGTNGSKSSSSSMRVTQSSTPVKITWNKDKSEYKIENFSDVAGEREGTVYDYDNLPPYVKKEVEKLVGDGATELYDYYFKGEEGKKAHLEMIPRDIKIYGKGLNIFDVLDMSGEVGNIG